MASVLAAGLVASVVLQFRRGLGHTGDTWVYLETAKNLVAGTGLTHAAHNQMTVFPPGIPAALALIIMLGAGPAAGFAILNATAGASVMVAMAWLTKIMRMHPRTAWTACTALALSFALHRTLGFGWSESAFLLLEMLALCFMARAIVRRGSRASDLIGMAVLGSGFFFVRYFGFALIIPMIAAVTVTDFRYHGLRRALFTLIATTSGALLLPLAWFARNVAVTGSAFGGRSSALHGLSENLDGSVQAAAHWLVPFAPWIDPHIGLGALLVAAIAVCLGVVRLHRQSHRDRDISVALLGSGLAYWMMIVVAASLTNVDLVGLRLMLPALPLFILGSIAPLKTIGGFNEGTGGSRRRVSSLMLGLWLIASGLQVASLVF